MPFFSVHAALSDYHGKAASWGFKDRILAEEKFKEVCGPLCAEAWLLRWTDDHFIRRKKEVHLERHWTFDKGVESERKTLGEISLSGDFDAQCDFGPLIPDVVSKTDAASDGLLNHILGLSVHNLHDSAIDFGWPLDDSDIHVLVDPDRIAIEGPNGSFEVSFVKVSSSLRLSMPDFESAFQGLALNCQWDFQDDAVHEVRTYAWGAAYRRVGTLDLERGESMIQMLRRIQEIETSLPSAPKSFGEYVAMVAQRLGLNPGNLGCLVMWDDAVARHHLSDKHRRLDRNELKIAIDESIANQFQRRFQRAKCRVFVLSDEPVIVETIPQAFIAKGCAALGSLSFRDGSWAYEKVLKEAVEFQPDALFIAFNRSLCPKVDGSDLPSRLLQRFGSAKVIITKVGDQVLVRDEVLDQLDISGRAFHIVDVPVQIDDVLLLIEQNQSQNQTG